jgi:hypothetical protein
LKVITVINDESHVTQVNYESSRVSGEAMRLGQAARATRAMVTCLLVRAVGALKYSRRRRRRRRRATRAQVKTSESGGANLGTVWVRWTY